MLLIWTCIFIPFRTRDKKKVPLSTRVETEVITWPSDSFDVTSVTLATDVELFLVCCLSVAIVSGFWSLNFVNVVDPSLFRCEFVVVA
jgi:hypothetical protein